MSWKSAHRVKAREGAHYRDRPHESDPERTRAIFLLRRLEGMKYLDIAARLNISVSTVEKDMQRAVAHLTTRLGDET